MASFRLRRCRIINDKIAISQEDPLTLSWEDLRLRFSPTSNKQELLSLRGARKGCFIGIMDFGQGYKGSFRLDLATSRLNLKWLTSQDKTFVKRVLELYKVEDIQWEDTLVESQGKLDP